MTRSGVVDTDTGGSTIDQVRTSSGTFFKRGEDSIIAGARDPGHFNRKIACRDGIILDWRLDVWGEGFIFSSGRISRGFSLLPSRLAAIEERIARWTLIAPEQGEGIQVRLQLSPRFVGNYSVFRCECTFAFPIHFSWCLGAAAQVLQYEHGQKYTPVRGS